MSATAEPKYAELGKRIRRSRKRAGFSQERLALAVGITRRHLIRLENGEHLGSRQLRDRIADATGLPSEDLHSADDDEEAAEPMRSLIDELLELARVAEVLKRNPDLLRETV